MHQKPPEIDWPKLPPRYDRALRSAVRYIIESFHPTAIIAAGTIIRGTPSKNSDFDLWVIHRKPFKQRVQKWFSGVPAEIFVNTPAAVLDHLEEEREERRPVAAHMMVNGHVVLDQEPYLAMLMGKARSYLRGTPGRLTKGELIRARYMAGSYYEDALDLADSDPATCQMILSRAVRQMLHASVKRANKFVPRDKDLLAEVKQINPALYRWAAAFYSDTPLKMKLGLAQRIADRTIQCRGFFAWESTPIRVTVKPK